MIVIARRESTTREKKRNKMNQPLSMESLFPGIMKHHLNIKREDIKMIPPQLVTPKKSRKRPTAKGGYIDKKYCNTLYGRAPPNSPS
jgi:hypothetical protein